MASSSSVQMGRIPDRGNWPENNEDLFMQMLCDRVRKDPDQNLSVNDWGEMDEELFAAVGVRYGIERLKGKHSRFRTKFRHFIQLLETPGVTWDVESNTVRASEKIWQTLTKQSKEFRTFRKKGCKHYDLLKQIFPEITGETCHLTMVPRTRSFTKPAIEAEFLNNKGVHIDVSDATDDSSMDGSYSKDDKTTPLVACEQRDTSHRPKKKLRMDQLQFGKLFDEALNVWVPELNGRSGDMKGNGEKDESQISKDTHQAAATVTSDVYSVENVMDILESMADVPAAAYMKAVDKFTNKDWRTIFVKMSAVRRREWLKTLV